MADNGKLSFTEKVAKARAEAAAKSSSPGNAPASAKTLSPAERQNPRPQIDLFADRNTKKTYFNCSIEATRIIVTRGKKVDFVNHFYITDDEDIANYIRENYCSKKSGNIKIMEVSEMFYQSSTMIQPEILPLPSVEQIETDPVLLLRQQQEQLDAS